jgi:hypothetical protein
MLTSVVGKKQFSEGILLVAFDRYRERKPADFCFSWFRAGWFGFQGFPQAS